MNVLITGGAGFIGSHLTRQLLNEGHSVHLLDNLSTGRRENVTELLGERCTLQVQSVAEAMSSIAWLREFDAIYHLAAAVGVQLIVDEPVRSIETNIVDTTAVLRGAAAYNIPVLLTSSSEVYGKGVKVPFSEDDDVTYGATIYNRWSYAAAKAIDEYLALAYHQQHDLPTVVVRLFNTVGPGQLGKYGMVIPRFIEAALAGEPLHVYGDGQQSRCFGHVCDIVGALPKLLTNPACHGRVFNLGSNEEVTIEHLAERIIALSGSKSSVTFVPYDEAYGAKFDDLRRRVPDLTRIGEAIGYTPTKKLDDILRELITAARG